MRRSRSPSTYSGLTGILTFGQSAFFGIGVYAAGLIFTHLGFSAQYAALAFGAA
jgi:branched-chain amino acid transport system permease protein